ncbi:hypothetical protein A2U01_0004885 [Trifolium medium]|uniref:Uncharacterized protein n=1 Tax=Trifolium medium TaxID=97028 RepID=A0A392MAD2_9FABA|nr:hypothetical protein [Trifolium medium]
MGGSWEVSVARSCPRKRRGFKLLSCRRWIKLEHGTKAVILFGACSFEEK